MVWIWSFLTTEKGLLFSSRRWRLRWQLENWEFSSLKINHNIFRPCGCTIYILIFWNNLLKITYVYITYVISISIYLYQYIYIYIYIYINIYIAPNWILTIHLSCHETDYFSTVILLEGKEKWLENALSPSWGYLQITFFVVLIRMPCLNVDILKSGLVYCNIRLNELHLAACLDGNEIYLKHRLQKIVIKQNVCWVSFK